MSAQYRQYMSALRLPVILTSTTDLQSFLRSLMVPYVSASMATSVLLAVAPACLSAITETLHKAGPRTS